MKVRRLPAHTLPPEGGRVALDADASRHARVLRLGEGDAVVLFDGRGREAEGRVAEPPGERYVCEVRPPRAVAPRDARVVLVQGLAKGAKLDEIVRMTTELGVSEIHLARCERSVPRPDDARAAARRERLGKVALEAARQSGRAQAPEVRAPAPLLQVAGRAPAGAPRLVFFERGRAELLLEGEPPEVWVVVGPEGGFSDGEIADLSALGYEIVGLGPAILRVETAAPVVVALVSHALGGLRP